MQFCIVQWGYIMAKDHANQTIVAQGAMPITKAAIVATRRLRQVARGEALADMAIAEAKAQGTIWTRYYRDMFDLDIDGRKAFRSRIAEHNKALIAYVKDAGGKDAAPAHQGAKSSTFVRLSELTTITKAMDAGVSFDKEWPFHYAVGVARSALKSAGAGSTRGRKATPTLEKLKAWITKNVSDADMPAAAELVATMAKLKPAAPL
jgi:hypothetical protein